MSDFDTTRDALALLYGHPAAVLALLDAVEAARKERDLAIAHDRQPYPTAWAYAQACKALEKHRARADAAEAALEAAQRPPLGHLVARIPDNDQEPPSFAARVYGSRTQAAEVAEDRNRHAAHARYAVAEVRESQP